MRGRVKGILTEAEVLALLELFALNSNASASAAPAPSLAPALIAASEPDEAEAVAARAIEAQRELALASAKQRAEQRGVERRLREAALKSAALRHKAPASSRASSYASSRTPVDLEPFLASLAKRFEETTTATTTVGAAATTVGAAAAATEAVAAAATDGTATAIAGGTRSTTATAERGDGTAGMPSVATTTGAREAAGRRAIHLKRPADWSKNRWRNYRRTYRSRKPKAPLSEGMAAAAAEARAAAATGGTVTAEAGGTGATTATAEGVAAVAISADSSEPALGTTTSRMTARPAGMTRRQWNNYKTISKQRAQRVRVVGK